MAELSPPFTPAPFKKQNSGKVKKVLGDDAYEELYSTELSKVNNEVIKEAKKKIQNALELLWYQNC